jgi:hypothetical protein
MPLHHLSNLGKLHKIMRPNEKKLGVAVVANAHEIQRAMPKAAVAARPPMTLV